MLHFTQACQQLESVWRIQNLPGLNKRQGLATRGARTTSNGDRRADADRLSFAGPGAPAAARLRDRRLLRRRRGLVPVQRVRPEEGAEEAESTRVQLQQDKAGAAGLEASRTVGGARLSCGSQSSNAADLFGL